ncbi:SRPBCC domain-containing protein [Lacisediminihabitans sp. G11-30]|uniref:SRPBCC domain-containing protein n=1 Tax=Lacisediminihabitans changchengi TaxID=2787634 RepID=A0A934SGK2_9MICO|nr:SRPBCC domain-containing protein [Lacisediminihabitans changchengi]
MTERNFTIARTLDVAPERVYQAWTEPDHLGWFFAEPEAENKLPEVDLRVGGAWRQLMVVDEDDSYITGGI